jgi:hypothetical protein
VALLRGGVDDGGEGHLRRRVHEARVREVDVRQELFDLGPGVNVTIICFGQNLR